MKTEASLPLRAVDVVTTLGVVVLAQVELDLRLDDGLHAGSHALGVVVAAVLAGALVLRRPAPGLGLLVMWGTLLLTADLTPLAVVFFGGYVPLAVMTAAAARRDRGWVGRWAWLGGVLTLVAQSRIVHVGLSDVGFDLGWLLVAWGVGRALRASDDQRRRLNDALAELARRRADREERARSVERGRMAAEMHDVVGHAASLMVLQLGAARAELAAVDAPTTPREEAERALFRLRAGEDAGRRALDELRVVIGALRTQP